MGVNSTAVSRLLSQARVEINDGSPARRRIVADRWIARFESIREPLADTLRAIAAEFRINKEAWTGEKLPRDVTPHADREDEAKARFFLLGGWVAATLDLILTLFISITALAFFWLIAGLIGVVIAILLALLVKHFLITIWNPELPRASVRRLTLCLWLSFGVCVLAIGVLLIARTVPFFGPAADLALALLSLALPVLAGSFFVLAHAYGRFGRLEGHYEQVRVQVAELDQLLRQLRLIAAASRHS